MATLSLLVGSVTGTALKTARALSLRLTELGFSVVVIEDGRLPDEVGPWLVCTSTTGAGEIPSNLMPFYRALMQGMYLPGQQFAVLALGDSAYANFAQSGRDIFSALIDCAATPLTEIYCLDAIYTSDPVPTALEWLERWVVNLHA